MKAFITVFLFIAFANITYAQNLDSAISLNGKSYVWNGSHWLTTNRQGEAFTVDARVITVKFKPGYHGFEQDVIAGHDGQVLNRTTTGFLDVLVPAHVDVIDFVVELQLDSAIAVAELNTIGFYNRVPNDTRYSEQWHLEKVMLPDAWKIQTGDPNIVVAVLDSGTEFNHPDLGLGADGFENIWLNPEEDAWLDSNNPNTGNGLDGSNGFVDDWKGWNFGDNTNDPRSFNHHGTLVAGCVAAKTNNGIGVAGVAGGWNSAGVSVLLIGVGESSPNTAAMDNAVLYAVENGAKIIQLSLSLEPSAALNAAFDMAYNTYGALIVCAAGNSSSGAPVSYPATNSLVMAVSASNENDFRADLSNFGPEVEVAAPGKNILSTDINNYQASSGTSFAAPIVSGIAALIWSQDDSLTNTEVRQLLKETADKVGGYNYHWNPGKPGHSQELGYGRVNAFKALDAIAFTFSELLEIWPNSVSIFDFFPLIR